MKFLIDTNRYSDFAKGLKEIVDLFASADCICVPYVVLAELRAGFRCGTVFPGILIRAFGCMRKRSRRA